ncbi:MAG: hypothetical protein DKM50_03975 [Candidatus Margulisiibacteriota bacterium]|nr:MAG: hypothetical protein A2X43_01690 [Candidatus Margulisbacteria bacterium GWD2_39_127]OGI05502.1 MAG: hypothetical protein A2X42_00145 [Candidatus Margulisbacteria bacterium GWF2_38_17]OGI08300.1 MAG: hypothetical protein A2X41_00100 [Candidatus Margulisbacteria bacterium GWE2_39_32]PZM82294.1 MAG: hypothetical protein DKM50_03975 [Candidatus Margulisiibacteriota bacterium]HAR62960.1 hypothetical protein [Candidatus Margulisiibacteriota bacterium]
MPWLYKATKGFSTIELLVVFSILLLISIVSTSSIRLILNSTKKNVCFQNILFDLQNARQHARLAGLPVEIIFGGSEYSVQFNNHSLLLNKKIPFNAIQDSIIKFDPHGNIYMPGTITFTDKGKSIKKLIISKQGRIRYE